MSARQLAILILSITALALGLAWAIERTQIRRFMAEFQGWYDREFGRPEGASGDLSE
jgi:hypothetical protein